MFLSTGGESVEVAVRMAKLYTGGFEVASLTRSWHGLTGGAAALTLAAGRRGYGPTLPGGFALPAPYAYRCPIRALRRRLRLHLPGGGLRPLRPGVGRRAGGRRGRAGAVGGRRDRPAAGLLRPAGRAVRRARDARCLRRVPDRARAARDDVRLRALRRGAGLPRAVQDARRRRPDRRRGDQRRRSRRGATSAASSTSPRTCPTRCRPPPRPAVLDVVREEDLPARADAPGARLVGHLRELQARHEAIGDVRGLGLLCGLELVEDRDQPARREALGLALTEECERARALDQPRARRHRRRRELPADGAAADDLRRRDRPGGRDPRRVAGRGDGHGAELTAGTETAAG